MCYAERYQALVAEVSKEPDLFKETEAMLKLRALDNELLPKVREITHRWEDGLLSCMEMVHALIVLTYNADDPVGFD